MKRLVLLELRRRKNGPTNKANCEKVEKKRQKSEQKWNAELDMILEHISTLSEEGDSSAICQFSIHSGDRVMRIPCSHIFHAYCIVEPIPKQQV